MTDEELIARLLDWEEYDEGDINDAREAAANRIKELKAELAGGNLPTKLVLADLYEAQAAEIKRLRAKLTKAEAMLEREIMRVKKIQSELPPPHKVSLFSVQSEYELMLAELKGAKS